MNRTGATSQIFRIKQLCLMLTSSNCKSILREQQKTKSILDRKQAFTDSCKNGSIIRYYFSESRQEKEFKTSSSWSKAATFLIGIGISLVAVMKAKKSIFTINCEEAKTQNEKMSEVLVNKSVKLSEAIEKARDLLQRVKDETGSPGLVVGVSVNGQDVWKEGLGYSDVENRIPCSPDTVFRIASISKAITMGMVAKLWEKGDLDLDKPIQHYLPNFPVKYFDGEKVEITTRQLVSHLGGIRHYEKDYMKKKSENKTDNKSETNEKDSKQEKTGKNDEQNSEKSDVGTKENKENNKKSEFDNKEYYIKKHYNTVTESLSLFQDDPLVHKPGSKFLYTTHGWTIISAIMEKVANKPYDKLMAEYFKCLGLQHTYLEENDPLVYYRGRHYVKNSKGRLVNAPYVDNSYKWAGGGFISDVTDLLRFGNIMLYSYQYDTSPSDTGSLIKGDNLDKSNGNNENKDISEKLKNKAKENHSKRKLLPGYLKKETMETIFSPVDKTECSWDKDGYYGMGWAVIPEKYENGFCKQQRHYVSHTGGAIGASSVLLILPAQINGKPNKSNYEKNYGRQFVPPQGVIVAIVVNMGSIGLNTVGLQIAKLFESVQVET